MADARVIDMSATICDRNGCASEQGNALKYRAAEMDAVFERLAPVE